VGHGRRRATGRRQLTHGPRQEGDPVSVVGCGRGWNGAGAWTSLGGARARGSNELKYF
jgi:hypothetical protein